jgi:CubicO group peptidase (beta-lactamase class C family)
MNYCDYTVHRPENLGLDGAHLADLVLRAQQGIDQGPLPSVQIALAKDGKLALFTTLGEANDSQRYNIFSCTKPLVASAIWLLMAQEKLDISQRVCELIPQFASNDKDRITVEHLLCHTAGIPNAPLGPPAWLSREGRLQKMQSWRLNWEPGSRMEYHATSAHWVLAEIIERLSEMDYRRYIDSAIISPLGLAGFQLGVADKQQGDITSLLPVGIPPTAQELQELFGVAMEWPDIGDKTLLRFNEAETRALGVPGGGAIASAASVALLYQCLLHNPGELWDPEILADATGRIRVTLNDPSTGVAANRALGVVMAGDDGLGNRRGMGKTVSATCFGHPGAAGQVAWADPASGISFCMLTNGLDANPIRAARFGTALSNRAGKCLAR